MTVSCPSRLEPLVDETARYLASREALRAIAADPYWPKWDGPWWRMTLLWEMGLAARVPGAAVEALVQGLDRHYLRFFPTRREPLPPGKDLYRDALCHCAVGTAVQVLHACGADVDGRLSWLRRWLLKYQLPDGGLNCENEDCDKPLPRGSVVSTLPCLEAVLLCTDRPFTPEEVRFLDAGARYLIERRLWRSKTDGRVIDPSWAKPAFPRFYFYDVLRGLTFLLRWARRLKRRLPEEAVGEVRGLLGAQASAGGLAPVRRAFEGAPSLRLGPDGARLKEGAASFPLLDEASRAGVPSPWLSREWAEAA